MNRSESIKELSTALVQAQAKIGNALKNKDNPFHKSKYADLEAVWDAAASPLKEHKLAVIQLPAQPSMPGHLEMETLLIHESGEYIGSTISMPVPKQDPQGYGSAMTYARRYALASLLGIVQSDDDGQGAIDTTANTVSAIEMINACNDMEELKKVFQNLFNTLDTAGKKLLTDAKDKRKEALNGAT